MPASNEEGNPAGNNNAAGTQDALLVTVISAIPLDDSQMADLEQKLSHIFKKRISMKSEIDPGLLGGLRIIAGYTIIDNTIKKKLAILKKNVYEGVYLD